MAFAACVVLALATVVGVSEAYSTGARMDNPMDTLKTYCTIGNFRPNHGVMPQTVQPPFELSVPNNVKSYRSGTPVEVTLRAKPGQTFKGFFITGDGAIATGGLTGTFTGVDANSKETKFCGMSGMTHVNSTPKRVVKIKWNPPLGYHHGQVQFRATVVKDKNTFWTGLISDALNPPTGVISQDVHMQNMRKEYMKKMQEQFQQMQRQMGQNGGRMGGAPAGGPGGAMDFSSMLGGMDFSSLLPGAGAGQTPTQGGGGGGAGSLFQRFGGMNG